MGKLIAASFLLCLISMQTSHGASQYEGKWAGETTGACGIHPLSVVVTGSSVTAGVTGLNAYNGSIDGDGKGTLTAVKTGRIISIAFLGDHFEIHGEAACGHIDGVAKRS